MSDETSDGVSELLLLPFEVGFKFFNDPHILDIFLSCAAGLDSSQVDTAGGTDSSHGFDTDGVNDVVLKSLLIVNPFGLFHDFDDSGHVFLGH